MSGKERIYVIQKHDASNLHYDLRLEFEGVLWSWAVPKKPPKEPGTKRLAIKVDDHDLEYADFEGEIKEGYGKGTVEIWDKGTFEPIDVKDDKIVFTIHGNELNGDYVLVRMNTGGDQENWLFFKKKN
ncbi:MAG: DNA polymerase ligase N-terminal domain-containing protein [Candidatus Aenigmatarchaeota archaeon]